MDSGGWTYEPIEEPDMRRTLEVVPYDEDKVNSVDFIGRLEGELQIMYSDSGAVRTTASIRLQTHSTAKTPSFVLPLEILGDLGETAVDDLSPGDVIHVWGCMTTQQHQGVVSSAGPTPLLRVAMLHLVKQVPASFLALLDSPSSSSDPDSFSTSPPPSPLDHTEWERGQPQPTTQPFSDYYSASHSTAQQALGSSGTLQHQGAGGYGRQRQVDAQEQYGSGYYPRRASNQQEGGAPAAPTSQPAYQARASSSGSPRKSPSPAPPPAIAYDSGAPKAARPSTEELWEQFFDNPLKFWDNRENKRNPRAPDFKHKDSGDGLWLNAYKMPEWVKERLPEIDQLIEEAIAKKPRGRGMGYRSSSKKDGW